MPRHASEHSCATCRRRKIKCDEARPICLNCRRAQRECQRPSQDMRYVAHSADPLRQKFSVESQWTQNGSLQEEECDEGSKILEAQSLIASDPGIALQHRTIATLFRHYIDFLAPWYDLNDSQSLFGTQLPQRAMRNSVLFKAVIAFSACHESRARTCDQYQELGHVFHGACVRDLLEVLNGVHPSSNTQGEAQGDYLSATCLLRSYEILNGDTRQQHHLLGAYSFASSSHINTKVRGLAQSGVWNYLREEITLALELRRTVRFRSEFDYSPADDRSDDNWAHSITYILARVLNFCFDAKTKMSFAERKETWNYLSECVSDWRSNRPKSFNPFSAAPKPGNAFPSIWLLRPWHVAGEQYLHVAEILLALSTPDPNTSSFGIEGRELNLPSIENHVLKVCGLAFTNNNIAARVNAFGGRYLNQVVYQEALVAMLLDFSIPTGWPVQPIIEDLKRYWADEE